MNYTLYVPTHECTLLNEQIFKYCDAFWAQLQTLMRFNLKIYDMLCENIYIVIHKSIWGQACLLDRKKVHLSAIISSRSCP